MHARVTISMAQSGKIDEAISIVQDAIVPAAKQQKGFKGYLGLTDRNTGKNMTITLWETEADMTACEDSGYYREQLATVAQLLAEPPTIEHFEVTIQA